MMKRMIGLGLALASVSACDALRSSTTPSPTPAPAANVVNYTAIGASDAIGYGGSAFCIPFTDCPNGTGYVQTVARTFKTNGKTVTLLNLGIPGAVLSPEIETLGDSIGRDIPANFIERELPFVAADSTLVTIFAGGNDVNTVGAAIDRGLGGADPAGYVRTRTQNFGRDFRSLLAGIKSKAPSAKIVVLNLPNMGALPYASGYTLEQRQWLQSIAVSFSAEINGTTSLGASVVDLMCDATFYQPSTFSSDGFHPNDSGYAYLAGLVYAAATGAATAPRSSCSQMLIY